MLINITTFTSVPDIVFRNAHPNTSFPRVLTDTILAPYGYAVLNPTAQPVIADSWNQRAVEGKPVKQPDGKWYQTWMVEQVTHTPEEEAAHTYQQKEARITEIKTELDKIDSQSMRPARAVYLALSRGNIPEQADVEKLAGLESQALSLRTELQSLPM